MKKLLVLALSLMTGFSAFAGPQGEDNGFGLKLFAGLHGDKYGQVDVSGLWSAALDAAIETPKASPALGFAIDNRWYVANPGDFGIAINARWLDFSFSRLKSENTVPEWNSKTHKNQNVTYTETEKYFDISALGGGVIGTYYLDDQMAIDVFYNILPNVMFISNDPGTGADSEASFAFGASHRIGAAYRFKVFQAGFELKIGKLKCQDWGKDDEPKVSDDDDYDYSDIYNEAVDSFNSAFGETQKINTNNFRIFLGFKF